MIDLPQKDKHGIGYLSYSQISLFLENKYEYIQRYLLKVPFVGNEYTDFGSKVGKALETNDYSLFDESEKSILRKVTRLDIFERMTILNYNDFYVIGFIDTADDGLSNIIDYKTGGIGKHIQYYADKYTQLCYYALSIKQEIGKIPDSAQVEFIHRFGNPAKGEQLRVGNIEPIKIPIDISLNRLTKIYYDTQKIALNISEFCKMYKDQNHV